MHSYFIWVYNNGEILTHPSLSPPSHRGSVGQRQAEFHGVFDGAGAADVDAVPQDPPKDLPKQIHGPSVS